MQICILGAHRSGTSALTRLTNMLGCYIGGEGSTIGFNDENPKGFWERRDVIEANDALLAHFNCRWEDLYQWKFFSAEDFESLNVPQPLSDQIKNIVLSLDHHRPWAIKDPRLCHTFALWRRQMELPAAIISWRDPYEVAMSLHTRNGFTLLHGLAMWEHAMLGAIIGSHGLPRTVVSYQQMMQDPVMLVRKIYDWAVGIGAHGLHMPGEEEITRFIDPSLYRSKPSPEGLPPLSHTQQALLDALKSEQIDGFSEVLSATSHETLNMVHQQRLLQDDLELREQEKESARRHADELQQQIESLQHRWQLTELEWKLANDRFASIEQTLADANQAINHRLDLLGDPGRIRRRLSKLLAAIGG